MAENLGNWPSGHGQITKIWPSDRCGGIPAAMQFGYNLREFGGYLGNVGLELIWEMSVKIVHHSPASPRRPEGNCYHHTKRPGRSDNKLDFYVGRDGIPKLLSFLDLGPYHDPEGQHIPLVSDMGEFAELMRFEPPDVVTDNSGME